MFNKKLLVAALTMALVGCGGSNDNNNNNDNKIEKIVTREYSAVLASTNLFSGEGVAVTKVNKHANKYSILTDAGVTQQAVQTLSFTNNVDDVRCEGARGSEIKDVRNIGNDMSLVKIAINDIVERTSSLTKITQCTIVERHEFYIVRHSDGKAWSADKVFGDTDAHSPLSDLNIQKPHSRRNSTDNILVNKRYSKDGKRRVKTYSISLPTGIDEKLVYKELSDLDGYLASYIYSEIAFDGEYIAAILIDDDGVLKHFYFEVETGRIPEYARGLTYKSSLPVVNSKIDGMVYVMQSKFYTGNDVTLLKGDNYEEVSYELDPNKNGFVHVQNNVNSVYTGNDISYVVTRNSSIVNNDGGIANVVYKSDCNLNLFTLLSKESADGSQFVVVNNHQALIIDYATGQLNKIDLNNGNRIENEKTAVLSGAGVLTYQVAGKTLFETVFRTLDTNTGEFGEDRIITSEDGRKVIEVLPVN